MFPEIATSANVFLRWNLQRAGDVHRGHFHHFDHVMFFNHGPVEVEKRTLFGPDALVAIEWKRAVDEQSELAHTIHTLERYPKTPADLILELESKRSAFASQAATLKLEVERLFENGRFTVVSRSFDPMNPLQSWAVVQACAWHSIRALVDDSRWCCVYAHRDAQGRITQERTGWEVANT